MMYSACQSQTHTAVSLWPLRKIWADGEEGRINILHAFSKQLAFFSLLNEDCSLISPFFFKSLSCSNFASVQLEEKRIKRKGKYRI